MLFDHIEEKEAVMRAAMIEVNGLKFYNALARLTEDRAARDVFKRLAVEEKGHLAAIEKTYFPEAGFPIEQVTEEEIAIEEYVQSAAPIDIFTRRIDMESFVCHIDGPKKALTVALNAERYSVDYFDDLGRRCRTEDGRRICRELADEERAHVAHIEGLIAALK